MKSGGRIIMIGSAVGERVAAPGLVPYAGTKGAVKMFTQALAREIGSRGITVNNVQPGPIDTELNPATGDWATPQKAATALRPRTRWGAKCRSTSSPNSTCLGPVNDPMDFRLSTVWSPFCPLCFRSKYVPSDLT
jgi:NAD(P)-dependent dehydrogenase (short-subunit alcohol dehydrogenase family)